ncbi:MAG TPA: alkaline phosphatase family protein, partial [Thermoanaerobaculia bacterium]|nr:alkaline phosphatase family protein [Thermoanaerobaculia bacterium]
TAVLGWWATWPAEEVRGVVASDRALLDPEGGVSPPAFRERFRRLSEEALELPSEFGGNPAARDRDRVMAHAAREVADEGFDLMLVYFRGVDIASHFTWKAWQPDRFPDADPAWVRDHADDIPAVYRATDAAIREVLAAAPEANVLVVSDHGFHAVREETRVVLDLDLVLEDLGFLVRTSSGGVDRARSAAYTLGSDPAETPKRVALGGAAPGDGVARLDAALSGVRYESGATTFQVRPPRPREGRAGVGAVVEVLSEGATHELLGGERTLRPAVREITEISGSHGARTKGIFIAHGPDVDPRADVAGIRIHDLAPTLLYALGLPVGEDMPGEPWAALFTDGFRRRHPLRTIETWGAPGEGEVTVSPEDQELIDELRGLGYL